MKRMKDNADKDGIVLEAIRMDSEYIMLRKGPERDRMVDRIKGNVQKAAAIGVKVITYHWTVIPIRRNGHAPGRGGCDVRERSTRAQLEGTARREGGGRDVG